MPFLRRRSMGTLLDTATINRWEYEDGILRNEMKDAAVKEAASRVNSPDCTPGLRIAAGALTLDDFRELGDLGFNTMLVLKHPVLGDTLRDALDRHGLLDEDAEYLPDAAEAFVTAFIETVWEGLREYENRGRS
jgi:hypothetical protein